MPDKLRGHFIKLYEGDFKRLSDIYTKHSPNYIIRTLVRKHLKAAEAEIEKREPKDE